MTLVRTLRDMLVLGGLMACSVMASVPTSLAQPAGDDFVRTVLSSAKKGSPEAKLDPAAFTAFMEKRMRGSGETIGSKAFSDCASVPAKATGRSFFLDPAGGRADGDGSRERPFPGLADFLKGRERTMVKGGDRLVLLSGDHGDATLSSLGNSDFVFVEADAGAKPLVRTLRITDAQRIVLRGVEFAAQPSGGNRYLLLVDPKAADIVVSDGAFRTSRDLSRWSDQDWVDRTMLGAYTRGRCVALVRNEFADLSNGIRSGGPQTVVAGNRFDRVMNDNIDFSVSGQRITGNLILAGRNNIANKLHADAIQGWTEKGAITSDIAIEGNLVLHYQEAKPAGWKAPADMAFAQPYKRAAGVYRQGISIFDGVWRDVHVNGNVVVTNSSYAISLYALSDSDVRDNVVLSSDPRLFPARMRITEGKDKTPTLSTVVEGNIVAELEVAPTLQPYPNTIISKLVQNRSRDPAVMRSFPPRTAWGETLNRPQEIVVPGIDASKGIYDVRLR